MNHWILLPVLVPAFTAVLLLLGARLDQATQRSIGVLSTLGLVGISLPLVFQAATGDLTVYQLGNWPAPFGIVLVLDRLGAMMVLLVGLVALPALLHAVHGWDTRGRNFHALFQFQLMGLNGAFLTGDLFNLFVFFEILLIASYGLVLHGGGADRVRAGLHYVVFNMAGSALFLIALGMVYGALGSLTMADLAHRIAEANPDQRAILQAASLLMLAVFSVKAAILPLYFWLPRTYQFTSAPVAALFAIMTKVGVYSILRVYTQVFSDQSAVLEGVPAKVLFPASLLTLGLAMVGVVAAKALRQVLAYLVIASVGTMMASIALFSAPAIAASLYYMLHSTLIIAALFLLAEHIADQRGAGSDALRPSTPVAQPALLGFLFFIAAVGVAGLPPLSGFLGKVFILQSALDSDQMGWLFSVVLIGGFLGLIAMGRTGTQLFWKTEGETVGSPAAVAAILPVVLLLTLVVGLSFLAEPISAYTEATAIQILNPEPYIQAVLNPGGVTP
jgi:multicomponent K+:H+ antiporter subunit D